MILTLADKVTIINLALEEIETAIENLPHTGEGKREEIELKRLEKLALRWRDALEAKGP